MPDQTTHTQNDYRLRAKLPQYFRLAAIGVMAITILAVVLAFYRERSRSPFKLRSEHTQLSTDVTADVNGYERLEAEGGTSKYYIKADQAKTFSDDHQELQNVYLETYDKDGVLNQKMTAVSALYFPEPEKNFTAYLKGNVQIETPTALKIKTENIVYTKQNETAEADELVEFERGSIRGRSLGANVRIGENRIELLKEVEIESFESPELAKANIRYAKLRAGSAVFDQTTDKIDLLNNLTINIESKTVDGIPRTTDARADRGSALIDRSDSKNSQIVKFEFFDNVQIVSTESGSAPTTITSGYALYDKAADCFELKNNAHIVTAAADVSTDITASEVMYEQSAGKIRLTGNAEIKQGNDYLRGDIIHATLFRDRKIKDAVIRGNASAQQTTTERITSVVAPELNAAFNESHWLHDANAIGQSNVEIIPNDVKEYSKIVLSAAKGIGLQFKGAGLIDAVRTDGRTTIQLNAPEAADAANKRITADVVRTVFSPNGKDISRAEAVGNAELNIEPLTAAVSHYKTAIHAPRFDCEFYPTGNNAKVCSAGKRTRTIRTPTVSQPGHGTQTLLSEQLKAEFSQQTKDIDKLTATGNARFTELDSNGAASEITYTQSDETVRFRGGEPTGWNSKYRAKAKEIDWNTQSQLSYLRTKVSTTYYSLKQMDNAAPFGQSDKPVFITSDTAEFDQVNETAVYTGNARGWQESNYVRGDKLTLKQREGEFIAEGRVQSAAYNIKMKQKDGKETLPVFAAADAMTYNRDQRSLHYRSNADIRQGPDRITAESAFIYLDEENQISKTVAEQNVVITQPGRRGTGDWLQYTAQDETTIIRGNPATVQDTEKGTSQAAQLTLYMREKRIVGEGKTKPAGAPRTKSVYKVQGKQ